MVALIPARSGSKRILHKNTRLLNGVPLLAYTIAVAHESGCFTDLIVSTDSYEVAFIAQQHGAHRLRMNPVGHQDDDPDDVWIRECLVLWPPEPMQTYAILRPTSPFRSAAMIRRALTQFSRPDSTADSLRAIRPVREHPAKMWRWEGPGYPIRPVWHMTGKDRTPLHSRPTQSLAPVYVQTSSLDMFWAANLSQYGTFGGRKIDGFLTDNIEGLALDEEDDWIRAEQLLASGRVSLPRIEAHSAPLSEAR